MSWASMSEVRYLSCETLVSMTICRLQPEGEVHEVFWETRSDLITALLTQVPLIQSIDYK